MDAAGHWDEIASSWLSRPGFAPRKMLTATGVSGPSGKVFAERLRARGKSPMREWITIGVEHHERWPDLVEEAHRFVG